MRQLMATIMVRNKSYPFQSKSDLQIHLTGDKRRKWAEKLGIPSSEELA